MGETSGPLGHSARQLVPKFQDGTGHQEKTDSPIAVEDYSEGINFDAKQNMRERGNRSSVDKADKSAGSRRIHRTSSSNRGGQKMSAMVRVLSSVVKKSENDGPELPRTVSSGRSKARLPHTKSRDNDRSGILRRTKSHNSGHLRDETIEFEAGRIHSRTVSIVTENNPLLELSEADTNNWGHALIVRYHNAIRVEVADLYSIVGVLKTTGFTSRLRGIFDEWWEEFRLLVKELLEAFGLIVLKQLDSVTDLEPPLDIPGRHSMRMAINQALDGMQLLRETTSSDDDWLCCAIAQIEVFSSKLGLYVTTVEEHVPSKLSTHYSSSSEKDFEQELQDHIVKECPHLVFPAVLRALPSQDEGLRWIRENFKGARRLHISLWQSAYERSHRNRFQEIRKLQPSE
mmetsp:Transcript_22087/g.53922  ORF Transcript_22087/g.53922 Transcript_22087/m.53922 type:complete len:401 (+) Transcript_22087:86-1288(+)|eukprot:CAMPEP_0198326640 /NCGR_PEP_ID=MMETSP1450-20131203/14115_1 /TAXON_ID=753684 ORGANISM="Madagascaria erythrocladiodes, Strain CCMP3234" /NCGR_SAMPLE_ID=MMETSP1450 /ASSEMBLY_ACC=CAM_ASM_001115 /LENGTH=400 /DNA_ID=CAMNT_0044030617 /DNA_START=42 /DNA_END=1244 /DNA_ORIENTATION=+